MREKLKKQAKLLYEAFLPEYILPKLKKYLKKNI
jgi:hypothetical protein